MKVERGDYLDPETKEVNDQLMVKLMACMDKMYFDNKNKLSDQQIADILFSCLVMFARDTLLNLLLSTEEPLKHIEGMLVGFSKGLADTLVERIKEVIDNPTGEVH